jgi:adenylate kinase family enzyme
VLVDPPPHLQHHRRIVVYGVTGSGKSTLAARLSSLTGIPLVRVDDLMWQPGWVQLSADEQVEVIRPHVDRPEWVMDAMWSATRPLVLGRTDLVVALDHPRRVSLGRLVRRTAARLVTREPVCSATIEAWAADAGPPSVLRLTSCAAADAWLRTLEHAHS